MSSKELKDFLGSVGASPSLLEELRALLPAPDAAIRWASNRGYRLTQEDVAELQGSNEELSDVELDKVAGGDTAWPPPPTPPTEGG
ncbi:MAG TPA: Nif11-like leader peptide family RiPP precursor [Thermoanaerobaculia bacterium]|jgi:predicted ribosomally synthesized peptide with nif11-like leader|nr:Nif11-like leader peptide family RiPP precursor [Thermoanaerobaculia bacterium]